MKTVLCQNITRKAQIGFSDADQSLKLKEAGPEATLRELTINGITDFIIAIKLDSFSCFSQYFKSAKDFNKGCDCVVIYKKNDRVIALFIEMKSDNPKGFIAKFKASSLFITYLKSLLCEFHQANEHLEFKYLLCSTRIQKQTIRHSPLRLIQKDGVSFYEKPCKNGSHIHVNEFG